MPLRFPVRNTTASEYLIFKDMRGDWCCPTDATVNSTKPVEHKLYVEGEGITNQLFGDLFSIDGEKPFHHTKCVLDAEYKYDASQSDSAEYVDVGVEWYGKRGKRCQLKGTQYGLPQTYLSYDGGTYSWNWQWEYENTLSESGGTVRATQWVVEGTKRRIGYEYTYTLSLDHDLTYKCHYLRTYKGEKLNEEDYTCTASKITMPSGYGLSLDQLRAILDEDAVDLKFTIYWYLMNVALYAQSNTGAALDAVNTLKATSLNNIENAVQTIDDLKGMASLAAETHTMGGITALPSRLKRTQLRDYLLRTSPGSVVKGALSATASLYLMWRYAIKPTIADIREMQSYFKSQLRSAATSMRSGQYILRGSSRSTSLGFTVEQHVKLKLDSPIQDKVNEIIKVIDDLGLLPTLQRGWDLVPYSFVADWVTNVGDLLGAIDYNSSAYSFPVQYCTSSTLVKAPSSLSEKIVNADRWHVTDFNMSVYDRRVSPGIPVDIGINLKGVGQGGHAAAASALLITRL